MSLRGISPPFLSKLRVRGTPKLSPWGEGGGRMRGLPPKAFPSGGRWPEGPDEGTPPKSLPPRGEGGWPSGQTDEGAMIEQFRFLQGGFAACGRRVTLPTAARRRKVHSTPFPPGGENCARSLAPPLPGEPTSLGFAGRYERDYPKRRRGRLQMSTSCS